MTPDQELVDQTLGGDLGAFEILVDRYRSQIFSLAYRLIGDKGEAEDMAQETFLKVYRNLNKFKPQLSFSTWLYKIATNICLSHLRRRRCYAKPCQRPLPTGWKNTNCARKGLPPILGMRRMLGVVKMSKKLRPELWEAAPGGPVLLGSVPVRTVVGSSSLPEKYAPSATMMS